MTRQYKLFEARSFTRGWGYVSGLGLVGLATLLGHLGQPFLTATDVVMLYLLCVVVAAIGWGLGPSILACVLGVFAHDFFFVEPYFSLGPPNIHDVPPLIVLLIVGTITSYLTSQARSQTEKAKQRELETAMLYMLSRELAATDDLNVSIRAIRKNAKGALGNDVQFLLPGYQDNETLKPYPEGESTAHGKDSAARASFQQRRKTGVGTGTYPEASATYVPLVTGRGVVGVMVVADNDRADHLSPDRTRLIDAFADLAAVAIERIEFARETQNMKVSQAATEKLQTAFLDSISHDLRTPITSVLGVLSSLQQEMGLDDAAKKRLVQVARGEAEKLNSSITNLLDISRIQAGAIAISRQSSDLKDIVSVALDELGHSQDGTTIKADLPAGLPSVLVDFSLIVKVMLNLIENAIKYSKDQSAIQISARQVSREVEIEVSDHGIGIPPQDLPYIFSRFYRVPHTGASGTGLGLSICKGIVEAHGGTITAENRHSGGTLIRLTLPIADDNKAEGREQ